MKFSELSSLSFVNLYAGDVPGTPEYRSTQRIGLSLTQDDEWHIRHDISKPLPIPDESVDVFQSEDVFEHIAYAKIPAIVLEIYRVLKKGGLFRLSVPDYRCDALLSRSIKDNENNILFDPCGGGAYKRRFLFFGKKQIVNGGHVWFPNYESVSALFHDTQFSSVEFLHYHDEHGVPHTNPIDYTKGPIQRTPDNVQGIASDFSIVVDSTK